MKLEITPFRELNLTWVAHLLNRLKIFKNKVIRMSRTDIIVSPSMIIQHCVSRNGQYDRNKFADEIVKLSQKQFNFFCDQCLSFYEFMVKYQGETVTDISALVEQYNLSMTHSELKKYTPEYLQQNPLTIERPADIIAEALMDNGDYNKQRFLEEINQLDYKEFCNFCERIRSLEHNEISQQNVGIISKELEPKIEDRQKWKLEIRNSKNKKC